MKIKILYVFIFSSYFFANGLTLNDKNLNKSTILVNSEVVEKKLLADLNEVENFDSFSSSTLYQIKSGYDINVDFDYESSSIHSNIDIPLDLNVNNSQFNISDNGIFPEENIIISDIMIFRGVEVRRISVIPFQYNTISKELTVFNNAYLEIEDVESFPIKALTPDHEEM